MKVNKEISKIAIALLCLFTHAAVSECGDLIKIAVIDTGYGWNGLGQQTHLCQAGHKDFTSDKTFVPGYITQPVPLDRHGHGTNIAGIIENALGTNVNYCLVILKYYNPNDVPIMTIVGGRLVIGNSNVDRTVEAIKYATELKVDYINYSGGGTGYFKEEADAVKAFLDQGGKFIAAAGNERADLAKKPYYPAMDDDRVIVVGNNEKNGKRQAVSNYGDRVNRWELGVDIVANHIKLTGTSQSAAMATAQIVFADYLACFMDLEEEEITFTDMIKITKRIEEISCH